jgi:Zn-dependent protease with chaperone function
MTAAAGAAGRFAAISGLLDLPFTLYQTFVVEERFGFNKMTWKLWLADAVKGTGCSAPPSACRSPR